MLNKKNASGNKKAFTLIELLIVIAIIAILVSAILMSIITARAKAKDASFKSTAKSIQTALVSCCVNYGAILGSTPGGLICEGGGRYPDTNSIGGTISGGDCVGNYFLKVITPGAKNSGNCTQATITTEEIIYLGC